MSNWPSPIYENQVILHELWDLHGVTNLTQEKCLVASYSFLISQTHSPMQSHWTCFRGPTTRKTISMCLLTVAHSVGQFGHLAKINHAHVSEYHSLLSPKNFTNGQNVNQENQDPRWNLPKNTHNKTSSLVLNRAGRSKTITPYKTFS